MNTGNEQNVPSPGIVLASVTASVTFGNPQQGGGPCVGKGVCKLDHLNPDATSVKFVLDDNSPDLLIWYFSLSELKGKQPDQEAYFTDPSGEYPFDGDYKLTDKLLSDLKFLPNPRISPTSPTKVEIDDDLVKTTITYDHD